MYSKQQINKKFGADVSTNSVPFSVRASQRVSTQYICNVFDVLENLTDIEDTISALSVAEEQDEVVIHLNCDGGSHYVGDALIYAMLNCKAPVHVIATGRVASYGTFILLSASSFEISPFIDILCHSASFGTGGKMQDTREHVEFQYKQCENMLRHYYKHFLTEEELNNLIVGKHEMYLTADQFIERYERRNELLQKELEEMLEGQEEEQQAPVARKPRKRAEEAVQ